MWPGLRSSDLKKRQLAGKLGLSPSSRAYNQKCPPLTCKGVSCGISRVRLQVVMLQCKLADASALLLPGQKLCSH